MLTLCAASLGFFHEDWSKVHPYTVLLISAFCFASAISLYLYAILAREKGFDVSVKIRSILRRKPLRDSYKPLKEQCYDLFVFAEITPRIPSKLTAVYALDLTTRYGKTLHTEIVNDLQNWQLAEKSYFKTDIGTFEEWQSKKRDAFRDLQCLDIHLSSKQEGWLHFRIYGVIEEDVKQAIFRVILQSKYGTAYAEREMQENLGRLAVVVPRIRP